jgi:hypothetical protein
MAPPRKAVSTLIPDGLAYWNRIRGDRKMPARANLDPLHIPALLPYVMLVDVMRDPLDFRYRLIGSEIDRVLTIDHRGKRLSELPGKGQGTLIWEHHRQVADTAAPFRTEVKYVGGNTQVRRLEHCLMPLSSDGARVDMIFTVLAVEWID